MLTRHKFWLAASSVAISLALQGCNRSPQAREAAFLKKGEEFVATKQYARAVLEFRNAIRVMPKDAEPYYQLGITCMQAGDLFNAFRAFHWATKLNPKYTQAQIKLAELLDLSQKSDFAQNAASQLKEILRASPDNEEATSALAVTEFEMGNTEQATQRLQDSLQKFPARLKTSVALARIMLIENNLDGAKTVLKNAVAAAPDSSAAQLALGQLYLMLHQPENAKSAVEKAIQLDPKSGPALLTLTLLQIRAKEMVDAEHTLRQLSSLPDGRYRDLHASFLYQLGQKDAAIAELETVVRDHSDDRQARSRLVAMYIDQNRTQDAQKLLDAALKRNRLDIDALFQRSQLYMKAGKPHQAELDLAALLHLQPNSASAHYALARVYAQEGLGNSERQELNNALLIDSGFLAARLALAKNFVLTNEPQKAIQILGAAPESQKSSPDMIASRNWALLEAGQIQEVRSTLNQVLQTTKTPELVLQDGLLKMQEKDYAAARADAEEVLKLKPQDSRGARLLADTYVAQNQSPQATSRLAQLTAAQRSSPSIQFLMGQWYMKNGQTAEAQKAFEAALAEDSNFAAAAINLAEIDVQEHHLDAARQLLKQVTARQSGNLSAFLLLANIEAEMGNRPGEISAYKSALTIDSSNEYALNNLAYALAMQDPDQAQHLAEHAVAIAPDNPAAQDTLGWIYYRKAMYAEAVNHLKAAVDREPNPRREFHLAMSYVKAGHPEEARDLLRTALKQDPNLATTEQGW